MMAARNVGEFLTIEYFGHIVSDQGVLAQPLKNEVMVQWRKM